MEFAGNSAQTPAMSEKRAVSAIWREIACTTEPYDRLVRPAGCRGFSVDEIAKMTSGSISKLRCARIAPALICASDETVLRVPRVQVLLRRNVELPRPVSSLLRKREIAALADSKNVRASRQNRQI